MKFKSMLALCAIGFSAFAEDYVITVEPDTSRAITPDEVAALAGKDLVKRGLGTLEVNNELASFPGKITISEGIFAARDTGALGTGDGMTYVNGGTLRLEGNLDSDSHTRWGSPCFPDEEIHVQGSGFANLGAIRFGGWNTQYVAKSVVLDGDATFVSGGWCNMSLNKVTIGSRTLTLNVGANSKAYVVSTVTGWGGKIVLKQGAAELSSWPNIVSSTFEAEAGTSVTMKDINADLRLETAFILKSGVSFEAVNSFPLYGPFTTDGDAKISVAAGHALTLNGTVSTTGEQGFVKEGDGTLVIASASALDKPVEVKAGTVKWGKQLGAGDYPHGLNSWYIDNKQCQWCSDNGDVHGNATPTGVKTGVTAAYGLETWRDSSGYATGAAEHGKWYFYKGYIKVPGEPGTKTKLNAYACLKRYVSVRIGNTKIIELDNNAEKVSGVADLGYTYMAAGPAFEVDAGWQPIWVAVGAYYGAECGPWSSYNRWADNFGVGINWVGTCTKQVADYVKLLDGQNGVQLATSLELTPFVEAGNRAQFTGGVTFAPGTVFDIGDATPYMTAAELVSLSGTPTVKNGKVNVGAWTITKEDIDVQPLTIAAGSSLTFAEDSSLTFGKELKPHEGVVIATAADENGISGKLPTVDGLYKLALSKDGRTLTLMRKHGLVICVQ